jgi:hypothetical protein|tara:strand:- start:107 stop:733 length:627 start_codon:yes stop_codon:yes gene_type:complete
MAYNNPIQKKESACKQLKSETGKPSGLMMEGSLMHMSALEAKGKLMDNPYIKEGGDIIDETAQKDSAPKQDIKEIKSKATEYKPADKRGVAEMSPYKMDHDGSPAEFTGMSGGSAFHNNDPYSKAAASDRVFADAKKSKYSRNNPKHAGSNFFPPTNPKSKKDLVKGKTADVDYASRIYDADQDGDSVFRDYNQDGTMLGRAVKKLFG